MTEKDEARKEWLRWVLKRYDQEDEKGKRDLFMQICKTASSRWTRIELEGAIDIMRQYIEADQNVH